MEWPARRIRWRKRSSPIPHVFYLLSLLLSALLIIAALSFSSSPFFKTLIPTTTNSKIQCGGIGKDGDENFLWYSPHSGFSNQVTELKNAILIAGILNRTLIIPPVLDHHAVALGSCPKFRVMQPAELRAAVWDHVFELVRSRRYVSIADIVDLSSVGSLVRTIDFRVFASTQCGVNMDDACFGHLCCSLSRTTSTTNNNDHCRSLLSGLQVESDGCVCTVEEDCRTTVWTYQQNNDGVLDVFQPSKELQKKRKMPYVRRRRDIYTALGPGSKAGRSSILAFGTVFTEPYKGSELYIDIHEAPRDSRIQALLKRIEFLPFASEIIAAGKDFATNTIKEPFLCAQLRLLDGQFKNHWKATFSALEQKIQSLRNEYKNDKINKRINIFIMTDLPTANWTGTYFAELARDTGSFNLHTLRETDEFITATSKKLMSAEHGIRSGYNRNDLGEGINKKECDPGLLPDILLYVEESVCSCASLGFVGTAGSTLAESIKLMRKNDICLRSSAL